MTPEVVADRKYATPLQDGRVGVALLNLPQEAMPQREDDLITQGITDLYFIFPGGFTSENVEGLKTTTLVQTSNETAMVNPMQASALDQSLLTTMNMEGNIYDLVVHLSGDFKTAFPDGDPSAPAEEESEEVETTAETEGEESAEDSEETTEEAKSLMASTEPGNVFLFADVDFISNQFAYRPFQFGNTRMYSPTNGNSSLLFNILDQATGSSHLIGSRSRAASRRPFTLVQEMEARAEQKTGEEKAALSEKLDEANARLQTLQSQLPEGTNIMQNPEVLAEIQKIQLESNDIGKKIRELEKDLKREKDALAANVTRLNVVVVPIIVAIIGIAILARRRMAAAAR